MREALKLALEALETNNQAWKHLADSGDAGFWEAEEQPFYEISVKAITTIKEALAQPERPWARLTLQEQIDICTSWDQSKGWGALYKAIDQALKEKNT